MQQVTPPPRRDPAPTRLSYRMQRLWLTPVFRSFLRVGLPAFALAFTSAWYLSDEGRRETLALAYADIRQSIEERPEFMVKLMAIDGASPETGEDIREIVPLDFPVSSFDLDLEQMRSTIAGLDAVARADLRIRAGGILQVSVQERIPAVVWRRESGLEVLDAAGHRVGPLAARTDRADLPLIAGQGADARVAEALALLKVAAPIEARVRGLVRMGERRWDVVLDRNQRILLPETGAIEALERVIALNQAEDMLSRDFLTVDMRNSARPTLRLSPDAIDDLKTIKTIEAGVTNG